MQQDFELSYRQAGIFRVCSCVANEARQGRGGQICFAVPVLEFPGVLQPSAGDSEHSPAVDPCSHPSTGECSLSWPSHHLHPSTSPTTAKNPPLSIPNPSQLLASTSSSLTPCPAKHDIFSSTIFIFFISLLINQLSQPLNPCLCCCDFSWQCSVVKCLTNGPKAATMAKVTLPMRKETLFLPLQA